MKILEDQYKKRVSVYRQRILFDNLKQTGENINDWYAKVKQLTSGCKFGNLLSERVKDKFVVALAKESSLSQTSKPAEVNKVQKVWNGNKSEVWKEPELKNQHNKKQVGNSTPNKI
ncbi:hypothetical protein JTB14_005466 [Gonioctena quinquepunctata]|nr:hypothetical protein JTB14_005466 [Gonioctena quinquepunctata]